MPPEVRAPCLLSNKRGFLPIIIFTPWDPTGRNDGVGCHFLLQGTFPVQGSNQPLLHHRQILYHKSHQGNQK